MTQIYDPTLLLIGEKANYITHRQVFIDRFVQKVDFRKGCWNWLGAKTRLDYGVCYVGVFNGKYKILPAHRFAYEVWVGSIPKGLHLDHLCRNPSCVNPMHLEAVTHRENVLRGITPAAENAKKTCCKRGHPFTDENTYRDKEGGRWCRLCDSLKHKAYREDRKLKVTDHAAWRSQTS